MEFGNVITYPAPDAARLQHDFVVKVRGRGQTDWQEAACYQVKVDMHEVRCASMAYFDFAGEIEVEITCPSLFYIYQVDVRPLSTGIRAQYDSKTIRLKLDHPVKLSIEVNKERFHNLHLFAGEIAANVPDPAAETTVYLPGNLHRPSVHRTEELLYRVEKMPRGRTICFGPGVHYLEECVMRIPSDTNVYLAGGAVVVGSLIVSKAENIHIYGRGCLYLAGFERFTGLCAIRISHGKNVCVAGIHLINPPHYSVYVGGSDKVWVEDITTFSCEGWADGVDVMSSRDVTVKNCFLRTSDDCIAIYGRRWDYNGDTRNIRVMDCSLWADVAHPTMIGTHGDYEHEGNCLSDIAFENLDILEHREHQDNYLGCLAINEGDKNTVRDVRYTNIRIEPFVHGKILDFQIKCNPDYNPAPGKEISHISLKDICYTGTGELPSRICGYSAQAVVSDVEIENFTLRGQRAETLAQAGIEAGPYTRDVVIR